MIDVHPPARYAGELLLAGCAPSGEEWWSREGQQTLYVAIWCFHFRVCLVPVAAAILLTVIDDRIELQDLIWHTLRDCRTEER